MNVAFLGLGTMGAPMALNVLRRGHVLKVWNRTPEKAAPLGAAGAEVAPTPAEAARAADVVVTMLSDPRAVDAVSEGPDGFLATLAPGAVVVDMSTVDPATARRLDEKVRLRGGRFLDAPVSGTRKPAEEGTLLIMVGGAADALELARPVLEAMGRVKHMGPVGQGMAMKLVLNALGAHMLTGFAAVMTLGVKQGLKPRDLLEVISGGAFASPLYASKGEKILRRDFSPDFTLALMLKDQDLVLESARALGYPMPTLHAIRDVLDHALAEGLGDEDLCGLVRLFEKWAEVAVVEK